MSQRPDGKPTVLVIDDESGILESLRILLKNEGFVPHTALGGRLGLEQIAALSPDIVLSDVRMPTVSGLEILTAAKQQDLGNDDDGQPQVSVVGKRFAVGAAQVQRGHP